jgi:hypothetical protein
MPIVANLVWLALTFPLYAFTVRAIVGEGVGLLFACAFPGILANLSAVQNGFVIAALIGEALLWIERKHWLAGGRLRWSQRRISPSAPNPGALSSMRCRSPRSRAHGMPRAICKIADALCAGPDDRRS